MVLLALGLFAWVQGRTDLTSWGVLEDQVPQARLYPLDIVTQAPTVRPLTYTFSTGSGEADLYLPTETRSSGGILLVNGVEREGRKLPEFAHLADSLCRAGFVVVAPDIPGLVHEAVTPSDIDAVVAAFQALLAVPQLEGRPAGMIGFSIGASLELLAAADPRIADRVILVDDIGGFARLEDVIQTATTNTITSQGRVQQYMPNPYVWQVGRNSLIAMLPGADDREALGVLFSGDRPTIGSDHPEQLARLTGPGRALYDLLANRDPMRVQELVRTLPVALREDFAALSPDQHVRGIHAYVQLLHDRGDPFIPVQESRYLASSNALQHHSSLLELDVLQHVELASPDLSPGQLFGFYLPQMARLNGYVRDTLVVLGH